MDKQESLEQLSRKIAEKKAEMTELVEAGTYVKAHEALSELEDLTNQFGELKAEIGKESITEEDVQKLRSIEPHRKSVQNMTDLEVAQTPKFEKLLYTELGAKSPYEMRNGNADWRNDYSKTVPIIEIQNHKIPKKISDLRKKDNAKTINQGTFKNRDTGIEIDCKKFSIDEIVAKTIEDSTHGKPVDAQINALFQAQEILENAVFFDSNISQRDSNNKSPNTLFMHKMYGVIRFGKDLYLTNLTIEETYATERNGELRSTSKRLYSLRDIKIAPMKPGFQSRYASLQNSKSGSSLGATISIPQLYEIVKTYDKKFFENPGAPGREEREVEQFRNAQFEDAKAELESGNPTSSAAESVIDKYARERGLTADEAAERLINQAEKFKSERDILRGKIDEVNEILEENPALKEEYRAKRDEHRERLKSKSISTEDKSRPTSPKPNGSKH